MNHKEFGKWGEERAKEFLTDRGFNIIDQNYRCPGGEIDLIGYHGDYLVFIEVKTRRSTSYGLPMEAVDIRKQYRYRKSALFYIKHRRLSDPECRFDVIEVWVDYRGKCTFNHIDDAF